MNYPDGKLKVVSKNSFTLIELLIVIGIIALLSIAVILLINPAERLKEARDSQRIQELSSLEQTIQLLETQIPSLNIGTASSVYISIPDSSSSCANLGLPTLPAGYNYTCSTASNYRNTNGSGWIPINFQSSAGALPALPIDPINTTSSGLYYTYISGGSFELNSLLESKKHRPSYMTDGGDSFTYFEAGSDKYLSPLSDAGLLGYWTFDEGSGAQAKDSSGYNNLGILSGTYTWGEGKHGSHSLNFYASGKLTITPIGMIPLSLVAWHKRDDSIATSTWSDVFSSSLASNKHYLIFNGSYMAGIFYGSFFSFNYTKPNDNAWHLYAVVYNSASSQSLYVDGILKGTINSGADLSLYPINFIGNWGGTYGVGPLDDVRIYNRALSASEIKALYDATK